MTNLKRIALIPGDGIGKEVIPEAEKLLKEIIKLKKLNFELVTKDWGADKWINEGIGLEENALEDLRENYDAILFGALGDPRIPKMEHGREILLGMRFGLDLWANVRPVKVIDTNLCPLKKEAAESVDMVIFRENTEDLYVSVGGHFKKDTLDEIAVDQSVNSRKGVERIIRHAFSYAIENNRSKVTMCDKSNAVRFGGDLWQRVFKMVALEYPAIVTEHLFVDVAAMEMIKNPGRFDVVVCNNLFGDILSDLGAGLIGSLGLASSSNINPGVIGLFEPVHGSAPDIAGKGIANPMATFLSLSSMMEYLGFKNESEAIKKAVTYCIENNKKPMDIGGDLNCSQTGVAVSKKTLEYLN